VLTKSTQKLLVINNIGFNSTIDIDSNSDCILDIGKLLYIFIILFYNDNIFLNV